MKDPYKHELFKRMKKDNVICSVTIAAIVVFLLWMLSKILIFVFSHWVYPVILLVILVYKFYGDFECGYLEDV